MKTPQKPEVGLVRNVVEKYTLPVGERVKITATKKIIKKNKEMEIDKETITFTGQVVACDKKHFTVMLGNGYRETFLKTDVFAGGIKVKTIDQTGGAEATA